MSAAPDRIQPFPFDTATPVEIHAELLARHRPGVPLRRCGRWDLLGLHLSCCPACEMFTWQWAAAAQRRPELCDVLPRLMKPVASEA